MLNLSCHWEFSEYSRTFSSTGKNSFYWETGLKYKISLFFPSVCHMLSLFCPLQMNVRRYRELMAEPSRFQHITWEKLQPCQAKHLLQGPSVSNVQTTSYKSINRNVQNEQQHIPKDSTALKTFTQAHCREIKAKRPKERPSSGIVTMLRVTCDERFDQLGLDTSRRSHFLKLSLID